MIIVKYFNYVKRRGVAKVQQKTIQERDQPFLFVARFWVQSKEDIKSW